MKLCNLEWTKTCRFQIISDPTEGSIPIRSELTLCAVILFHVVWVLFLVFPSPNEQGLIRLYFCAAEEKGMDGLVYKPGLT